MVQREKSQKGRLRIGDDWNAITIIALSQNNPLKAVAEFVENSIDARASTVTIIRGREKGAYYLKVMDDGQGVPPDQEGIPDFKYVATHVCDSLKRKLKLDGARGIQGEFGIGLLSFWTIGGALSLVCSGADGRTYEMIMSKGKPGFEIRKRPHLIPIKGTTLRISPLLEGLRSLSGEKIQRYLASELRDRIRTSGVRIKVVDRVSRTEGFVAPREFSGRLLHDLSPVDSGMGDIYTEIYLCEHDTENRVGLYRNGTRILEDMASLDEFREGVWGSGFLQGIVDVSFLTITPGTRDGIIRDESFARFVSSMAPLEKNLAERIREQQKAEEERASRNILKSVQGALREAIDDLPPEEYDWFDLYERKRNPSAGTGAGAVPQADSFVNDPPVFSKKREISCQGGQKQFFEFPGPLFSARIYPVNSLVAISGTKTLRAAGLDKNRRVIDGGLNMVWNVLEGKGALDRADREIVTFSAPEEPGLTRIKVDILQGDKTCSAECTVTVVDSIVEQPARDIVSRKGLPGYTLESSRGQMWRSRYDEKRNVITINSGHRDFVFASRNKARKVRYILRLFSKELVAKNFVGLSADDMMERLVELSLYTEERLH